MKKFKNIIVGLTLAGLLFTGSAIAVSPSDYDLTEGDVISAWNQANYPDVYIVNDWGYKRLFLEPEIFNLYGHLG